MFVLHSSFRHLLMRFMRPEFCLQPLCYNKHTVERKHILVVDISIIFQIVWSEFRTQEHLLFQNLTSLRQDAYTSVSKFHFCGNFSKLCAVYFVLSFDWRSPLTVFGVWSIRLGVRHRREGGGDATRGECTQIPHQTKQEHNRQTITISTVD